MLTRKDIVEEVMEKLAVGEDDAVRLKLLERASQRAPGQLDPQDVKRWEEEGAPSKRRTTKLLKHVRGYIKDKPWRKVVPPHNNPILKGK